MLGGNSATLFQVWRRAHASHASSSGSDARACRYPTDDPGTAQPRGRQRTLVDVSEIESFRRGRFENRLHGRGMGSGDTAY